uniref:Uncharacterized protein n=1 Tax=Chromera velia CCMP2878 TaxID=1169474 RepID=A0A0G4FW65_9ALVE|eukprot:Cvel_3793.t1-p1 / transcript=Cvel_3793.t1 / gene=Cvel_3793 / organism=Chromera_velia_CCMP2878 / gene_product=Basic proline-rich protein, putative / transcript_product=Basic proline-rich protein, putative / location=Cvel_scaffold159:80509-88019(+) / protein_length=1968 / sequence_SO=supercontig / SO=protein_coding / is_pseudo=false
MNPLFRLTAASNFGCVRTKLGLLRFESRQLEKIFNQHVAVALTDSLTGAFSLACVVFAVLSLLCGGRQLAGSGAFTRGAVLIMVSFGCSALWVFGRFNPVGCAHTEVDPFRLAVPKRRYVFPVWLVGLIAVAVLTTFCFSVPKSFFALYGYPDHEFTPRPEDTFARELPGCLSRSFFLLFELAIIYLFRFLPVVLVLVLPYNTIMFLIVIEHLDLPGGFAHQYPFVITAVAMVLIGVFTALAFDMFTRSQFYARERMNAQRFAAEERSRCLSAAAACFGCAAFIFEGPEKVFSFPLLLGGRVGSGASSKVAGGAREVHPSGDWCTSTNETRGSGGGRNDGSFSPTRSEDLARSCSANSKNSSALAAATPQEEVVEREQRSGTERKGGGGVEAGRLQSSLVRSQQRAAVAERGRVRDLTADGGRDPEGGPAREVHVSAAGECVCVHVTSGAERSVGVSQEDAVRKGVKGVVDKGLRPLDRNALASVCGRAVKDLKERLHERGKGVVRVLGGGVGDDETSSVPSSASRGSRNSLGLFRLLLSRLFSSRAPLPEEDDVNTLLGAAAGREGVDLEMGISRGRLGRSARFSFSDGDHVLGTALTEDPLLMDVSAQADEIRGVGGKRQGVCGGGGNEGEGDKVSGEVCKRQRYFEVTAISQLLRPSDLLETAPSTPVGDSVSERFNGGDESHGGEGDSVGGGRIPQASRGGDALLQVRVMLVFRDISSRVEEAQRAKSMLEEFAQLLGTAAWQADFPFPFPRPPPLPIEPRASPGASTPSVVSHSNDQNITRQPAPQVFNTHPSHGAARSSGPNTVQREASSRSTDAEGKGTIRRRPVLIVGGNSEAAAEDHPILTDSDENRSSVLSAYTAIYQSRVIEALTGRSFLTPLEAQELSFTHTSAGAGISSAVRSESPFPSTELLPRSEQSGYSPLSPAPLDQPDSGGRRKASTEMPAPVSVELFDSDVAVRPPHPPPSNVSISGGGGEVLPPPRSVSPDTPLPAATPEDNPDSSKREREGERGGVETSGRQEGGEGPSEDQPGDSPTPVVTSSASSSCKPELAQQQQHRTAANKRMSGRVPRVAALASLPEQTSEVEGGGVGEELRNGGSSGAVQVSSGACGGFGGEGMSPTPVVPFSSSSRVLHSVPLWTDFVTGPEREALEDALEVCLRDGTPFFLKLRFERPDGQLRWFECGGKRVLHRGQPGDHRAPCLPLWSSSFSGGAPSTVTGGGSGVGGGGNSDTAAVSSDGCVASVMGFVRDVTEKEMETRRLSAAYSRASKTVQAVFTAWLRMNIQEMSILESHPLLNLWSGRPLEGSPVFGLLWGDGAERVAAVARGCGRRERGGDVGGSAVKKDGGMSVRLILWRQGTAAPRKKSFRRRQRRCATEPVSSSGAECALLSIPELESRDEEWGWPGGRGVAWREETSTGGQAGSSVGGVSRHFTGTNESSLSLSLNGRSRTSEIEHCDQVTASDVAGSSCSSSTSNKMEGSQCNAAAEGLGGVGGMDGSFCPPQTLPSVSSSFFNSSSSGSALSVSASCLLPHPLLSASAMIVLEDEDPESVVLHFFDIQPLDPAEAVQATSTNRVPPPPSTTAPPSHPQSTDLHSRVPGGRPSLEPSNSQGPPGGPPGRPSPGMPSELPPARHISPGNGTRTSRMPDCPPPSRHISPGNETTASRPPGCPPPSRHISPGNETTASRTPGSPPSRLISPGNETRTSRIPDCPPPSRPAINATLQARRGFPGPLSIPGETVKDSKTSAEAAALRVLEPQAPHRPASNEGVGIVEGLQEAPEGGEGEGDPPPPPIIFLDFLDEDGLEGEFAAAREKEGRGESKKEEATGREETEGADGRGEGHGGKEERFPPPPVPQPTVGRGDFDSPPTIGEAVTSARVAGGVCVPVQQSLADTRVRASSGGRKNSRHIDEGEERVGEATGCMGEERRRVRSLDGGWVPFSLKWTERVSKYRKREGGEQKEPGAFVT